MTHVQNIPVVILCGGKGTRLKEETEYRPKPLVTVGGMPILWHIMKIFSQQGFNNFILCLGYKGDMIKEFFLNYEHYANDFTLNFKSGRKWIHNPQSIEDWNITFVNTGLETSTAGRLKKVEKYVHSDQLMLTYGDGVADIDLNKLLEFHNSKEKMATITGIHPRTKYGVVEVDENNLVSSFREKPVLGDLINGGFMVFQKEIFSEINEDCMLVEKTLPYLATKNQLSFYKHEGFWHCMDTHKDFENLNKIWRESHPWKIWEQHD
jgi:glucose-1-phosphate cytidylyltransferase